MYAFRNFILIGLLIAFGFSDKDCPNISLSNIFYNENRLQTLRLMQYNVEWFFLDYYKPADCPGDGCTWKNYTMSLEHTQHLANVISKYSPDIINLCEVEGCDELNTLIQIVDPKYSAYLIQGTDTSTGQNVGMITKITPTSDLIRTDMAFEYPITGSKCGYNETGNTHVSKHFITTFLWNDIKIAYFSIHLIAYPTQPDRCAKREAQAKIIETEIIKYKNQGYEIVVIGDFNDYDESIHDINNSTPTSQTLDIIRGKHTDEYTLENVASRIIKNERFTNWWDKNEDCYASKDELIMIDFILLSRKLLDLVTNVEVYHGYTESCYRLDSDHYPVIVDFLFK